MPRKRTAKDEEAAAAGSAATEATEAAPGVGDGGGAAAASDEPATATPPDELEGLRAELAEARERAERYHANWQRSAADFLNWKRRADQEKTDSMRVAEAGLAGELLRVLDDFERAFQTVPPELRALTWVEGVAMIWQKTFAVLQSRGLSPIEALGQDFDPYVHEAVMREEEGDPSEQTAVVAELQRGYRFHDRVIRPTLVKVGRQKQSAVSDQPSAASDEAATTSTSGAAQS